MLRVKSWLFGWLETYLQSSPREGGGGQSGAGAGLLKAARGSSAQHWWNYGLTLNFSRSTQRGWRFPPQINADVRLRHVAGILCASLSSLIGEKLPFFNATWWIACSPTSPSCSSPAHIKTVAKTKLKVHPAPTKVIHIHCKHANFSFPYTNFFFI